MPEKRRCFLLTAMRLKGNMKFVLKRVCCLLFRWPNEQAPRILMQA